MPASPNSKAMNLLGDMYTCAGCMDTRGRPYAVTPGDGWAATLKLELLRHHSCSAASARIAAGFGQGWMIHGSLEMHYSTVVVRIAAGVSPSAASGPWLGPNICPTETLLHLHHGASVLQELLNLHTMYCISPHGPCVRLSRWGRQL